MAPATMSGASSATCPGARRASTTVPSSSHSSSMAASRVIAVSCSAVVVLTRDWHPVTRAAQSMRDPPPPAGGSDASRRANASRARRASCTSAAATAASHLLEPGPWSSRPAGSADPSSHLVDAGGRSSNELDPVRTSSHPLQPGHPSSGPPRPGGARRTWWTPEALRGASRGRSPRLRRLPSRTPHRPETGCPPALLTSSEVMKPTLSAATDSPRRIEALPLAHHPITRQHHGPEPLLQAPSRRAGLTGRALRRGIEQVRPHGPKPSWLDHRTARPHGPGIPGRAIETGPTSCAEALLAAPMGAPHRLTNRSSRPRHPSRRPRTAHATPTAPPHAHE